MTDLPEFLSAEVAADPYAYYRRLRAEEPVRHDEVADVYLISRHADVSAAYRNPIFTTANYERQTEPVMGRTLLQMEGREHTRKRSVMVKHFRGAGLDVWLPAILRNIDQIVDAVAAGVAERLATTLAQKVDVDLLTAFARYLPVYVIADMLGLPKADHKRFYAWYSASSAYGANFLNDPMVAKRGLDAAQELRAYLGPLIRERRADPGPDLISILATLEIDGELMADEESVSHLIHLLHAGSETTEKTIGNLFNHLLSRRELFEAVRDDRSLVTAAISETLRFTPPSQMNGRVTGEEVEVDGHLIPGGSFVWLLIASANRDERRFRNSEVYDPFRTDLAHNKAFTATGEHFAFGHGRHFCLGALLAKAELEAGTNALLSRFPNMRLADDFTAQYSGLKMRAVRSLLVYPLPT
jgi:cytochrome P450